MADVDISHIVKRFAGAAAVDDVTLSIASGAFLALLGPSGCGKTTLLRLIAGLERPDAGAIAIRGRSVASPGFFVEAEARGLGMVFQSYALWPHMSVRENVEFGLRVQRMAGAARHAASTAALEMVGLGAMADRRQHELSGGQRQRVALARSLATKPPLILLDEPLANLDAALRESMLGEFRRIHRETGTTFVFVTHDQSEAMAVADVVAVMDRGRIEQVGPPPELYAKPATAMVARFVGRGRTLPVEVDGTCASGRLALRLGERRLEAAGAATPGPGWLCLRASDIRRVSVDAEAAFFGTVVGQRFDDGAFVASLVVDGAGETAIELRSPVPLSDAGRIAIALDGGWVLPRDTASRHPPVA